MSGMPGILTSETTKKKLLGAEVPKVLFFLFFLHFKNGR